MRFRTLAIAAVVLVLAATAGLAAFQVSDQARAEAGQQLVEREDSLAVEPGFRQTLVSDANHTPTAYGDTVTVVYNGTELAPDGNYSYYPNDGEIEFLTDEPGEATITYTYEIPANQVADAQLQTLTEANSRVLYAILGGALITIFLFVGGFAAKRIRANTNSPRGR